MRLSFKEDIEDFLPLSEADREQMAAYQERSGMNRLYVVFEKNPSDSLSGEEDNIAQAKDRFIEIFEESLKTNSDSSLFTLYSSLPEGTNPDSSLFTFHFSLIPLVLKESDYQRMDSLLAQPDFINERLEADIKALMFPTGDLVSQAIGHDPLGLWTSLFTSYISHQPSSLSLPSFGSSETDKNAQLIDLLDDAIVKMQADFPDVKAHVMGGPQIAVGNARQIKRDCILAVMVALTLIVALLLYAFRSFRDILLIVLSVGWGWLFALGAMSLSLYLWGGSERSVSLIAIGISSIIIGIAVNYPLHLISHVQHQPDIRQAMREITKPLLVGNITTVGAFLALVPLKSQALRDLGLFASFLLIGTILFVLVWLPSLIKVRELRVKSEELRVKKNSNLGCKGNYGSSSLIFNFSFFIIAVLTVFFAYFSFSVEFDTDLSNINYMTSEQKADMERLQNMSGILPSSDEEQEARIRRWNEWVDSHPQLLDDLNAAAQEYGFADDAFSGFATLLTQTPTVSTQEGSTNLLPVWGGREGAVEALSDDFNYIGWVCSSIVFLFLWLSFRSIKLAIISFIPMAVSWIWILGIMAILGIKFNIVNIILATFIFGQGDDYTIFMTEGCVSEYKHGRPVLASYKRSIILSALIMFIGIGSLILAKHPALHSLAEVTIIGMFSVVLMAYVIPPVLYKFLIKSGKEVKGKLKGMEKTILLFAIFQAPITIVLLTSMAEGR